ncbi:MAG: alcohol dehydrogenase catalytic domain-containing protein [Dactylosporangium sp.]|nr:alcohol dehydrogenase catalytic domain-containing protein [Dactylosporangium sp.]
MLVARLHGVSDLRIVDEPVPVPTAATSLVRVTAVGLCGSDLHWYTEAGIGDARLEQPLVLGHEIAGVVEGGPHHGQRVAVDPAIPCEACETCAEGHPHLCPTVRFAGHGRTDGALREYLTWPSRLLHPLPDQLSDADGAMLEPLGVAIHALDLGRARVGATVAVVGCGPIGLLLLQAARVAGATRIIAIEPLGHRAEAARRLGADLVVTPEEADRSTFWGEVAGRGVDVAFEVAGTDGAVRTALAAARPGGRVVLVGIPDDDQTAFPAALARRKGLTIAVARRMNRVYPRAIRLVQRGLVDVASLVTARYPLKRAAAACADAATRSGIKVIVG